MAVVASGATALASPTYYPTGPFVTSSLRDGSRNGAVSTLSANGRYAVYNVDNAYSLSDGSVKSVTDVVVFDRDLGTATQITFGEYDSHSATISGDGRYVVFVTSSADLLFRSGSARASDPADLSLVPQEHIYLADLQTNLGKVVAPKSYELVDRAPHEMDCMKPGSACLGADGPAAHPVISSDGNYVAYDSKAYNIAQVPTTAPLLSRVYVWERATKTTLAVTPAADGDSLMPSISA